MGDKERVQTGDRPYISGLEPWYEIGMRENCGIIPKLVLDDDTGNIALLRRVREKLISFYRQSILGENHG